MSWDCSRLRQPPPGIPNPRLLLTSRIPVAHTDALTACLRHDAFLSALVRGRRHRSCLRRCLMRRVSLVLCVVLFGLGTTMGQGTNAQEATPSAGPVEFLRETSGDPDSPLGNPSHLAVAPDGNIWVVDGDN